MTRTAPGWCRSAIISHDHFRGSKGGSSSVATSECSLKPGSVPRADVLTRGIDSWRPPDSARESGMEVGIYALLLQRQPLRGKY